MILTIAYNHKDIDQTLRVLRWMTFLSNKSAHGMKSESLLLVPSIHVIDHEFHPDVLKAAQSLFGTCIVYSPPSFERGWPDSCNYMFAQSLEYVEREELGDMFWFEPDCVPIEPEWYFKINEEWKTIKKRFMGGLIPKPYPHMNGNGIYASTWRDIVPELVNVPKGQTWDMYAAPQMVPYVHNSLLFEHIWKPKRVFLDGLRPGAVVFHQDKTGSLIKQIDAVRFGGECFQGKNDIIEKSAVMTKYFKSINASAPQKSAGIDIQFELCELEGDHWTGVYVADDATKIVALNDLCLRKKSITEITEAEYKDLIQKKTKTQYLVAFDPLRVTRVGHANPVAENSQPKAADLTVSDVAKISKVTPAQPDDTPKRGRTKVISAT